MTFCKKQYLSKNLLDKNPKRVVRLKWAKFLIYSKPVNCNIHHLPFILIVPKKVVKSAVKRSKIRRIIKNLILNTKLGRTFLVVVIVSKDITEDKFGQLLQDVKENFNKN